MSASAGCARSTSESSPDAPASRTSASRRIHRTVIVSWYFSGTPAAAANRRIASRIRDSASSTDARFLQVDPGDAHVRDVIELGRRYGPFLERPRESFICHPGQFLV